MKKIFLTLLCLFTGISFSFSQTQKGDKFWVVEGSYWGGTTDNNSFSVGTFANNTRNASSGYNDISIEFKIGKFVKDNVAIGWGANYNYFNNNYVDTKYFSNNEDYISSTDRHSLKVDYFITRFIPVMNHLYLFIEADAGLSFGLASGRYTSTATVFEERPKVRSYQAGISLNSGLRYFVGKTLFINAATTLANVSYNKDVYENYTSSFFNLSSRLSLYSLNIGIGKNF